MESNTGYKYISKTEKGFVVSLPPEVAARVGQLRIQRVNLQQAIYQRNAAFGFDPDVGPQENFTPQKVLLPSADLVRFGAVGDTHLCSKFELLEELHQFYAELKARGVSAVFHAGNWIDGDKYLSEVHTWGLDNQADYFIENYPRQSGITTYFIDGDDHESIYLKTSGVAPGRVLQERAERAGRTDLKYLGYVESPTILVEVSGKVARIRVAHGGGGSARGVSLAGQNIVDSWTEQERPDVLILGHYHKAHFLPNYRGTAVIQVGTFQGQTTFMRKKNLHAHAGGWIVEIWRNGDGRLRVGGHYLSYHPKPWSHFVTNELIEVNI